jgi:hypothetical protein
MPVKRQRLRAYTIADEGLLADFVRQIVVAGIKEGTDVSPLHLGGLMGNSFARAPLK